MRRSGWVQTGHVKRNESRSRTWLGRDPRYPDHRSRSASFLCREFKLDTTTLHPQPVKLAPRLPNHPGEILLYFTALYSTAPRSSSSYLKRILKFPSQKLSRRAYKNSIGDLTRFPFRMLQILLSMHRWHFDYRTEMLYIYVALVIHASSLSLFYVTTFWY